MKVLGIGKNISLPIHQITNVHYNIFWCKFLSIFNIFSSQEKLNIYEKKSTNPIMNQIWYVHQNLAPLQSFEDNPSTCDLDLILPLQDPYSTNDSFYQL